LVLNQAFHGGQIDFDGQYYKVHGRVPNPPSVPVYHAALRPTAYEVAGEVAEGAISWVTPTAFLRDVAKPALMAGAAKRADGVRPRLVGHAFGLVSDDVAAVKQLGRERLAGYTRMTFYQEMFAAAGHPEARGGVILDDVVDDLVLTGNEEKVTRGIRRFLDAGCDELILSLIPTGQKPEASVERTLRLLGGTAF
jgi:alkanesulfonate monooxygenase SsuD/methylene tetrahydromethanopterin reductase-like flavin-dependent oxidoreductase (luciferase family)